MASIRIGIRPGLAGLNADEEPLRASTRELVTDLRSEGLPPVEAGQHQPGSKGQIAELMITLGGPTTAVAAAVRIFHLWLKRDRRRSLTLTIDRGSGRPSVIRIEGEAVSERLVSDAVQKLVDGADEGPRESR